MTRGGARRLRVAVLALAAVIAGVVGVAAPASAAIQSTDLAAAIDCTSLQGGYYASLHVTGTVTGLTAAAQYTGDVRTTTPFARVAFGAPIVADAQGTATIDATISASFVSGDMDVFELFSGATRVFGKVVSLNTCGSGVPVTGTLSADAICTTRYIAGGVEAASIRRIHGTLEGFLPAQTYTFTNVYAPGYSPVSAVADANGSVQLDFTSDGLENAGSLAVSTTSQHQTVGSVQLVKTDPCQPMWTSWPARAVPSDVNDDGVSDLVAIDFTGRLLYFQGSLNATSTGVPFTTSQTIGSGWGPQFGFRLEAMGDLTGDGYSEIVAVRSDGALVAYYNNINSNPGRLPYSSGTVIGSGWQGFTSVTLGDVNDDGYADLIARKADGSVWLYMNRILANPGHVPYTSGVPLTVPGLAPTDSFVAADVNRDGFADVVSYAGWVTLNRAPAGSPQMFIAEKGPQSGVLSNIGSYDPRAGWAVGSYDSWNDDTGLVIANPNGDGTLLYLDGLNWALQPRVIGSGWQNIRSVIS